MLPCAYISVGSRGQSTLKQMCSWANPTVARLAQGDLCQHRDGRDAPEFCGLVLNCSWPMPTDVLEQYGLFSERLRRQLPAEAYVYPASTLHCTICTMRPFTAGPLDPATKEGLQHVWQPILDAARARWASTPFRLRMNAPTLEGSAAIFRFDDCDGAMAEMRSALKEAIASAGGNVAEGGGDRSLSHAPDGVPSLERSIGPHLPDIVHSTAVRWVAEPDDREAAAAAFAEAAKSWVPVDVIVQCAKAVFEDIPYSQYAHSQSKILFSRARSAL